MYLSLLFLLRKSAFPSGKNPRGNSHIKVTGCIDSLWGQRFQILVSLGVFGMERHNICPFRYRLGLSIKKLTKNTVISGLL